MPDIILNPEDDRRIRDLFDTGQNPLLTDFIAADRPGAVTAMRFTFQQVAGLLSNNIVKQLVLSGPGNPDNALGSVGDIYFAVPADGSALRIYQKGSVTWGAAIVNIPRVIPPPENVLLYRSFTIPEEDILDGVVYLAGRTNDQGDQIIPAKATWAVETEDGSVGRYSNATQTVDGLGSGGIEVYLVGVESVLQLTFTNLVGVDMIVSLNSSPEQTLITGDTITVLPGDSFVARVVSFAEGAGLGNQNGIILNTDGGQLLEEVNHEWIIPIDSTSFEIYFI